MIDSAYQSGYCLTVQTEVVPMIRLSDFLQQSARAAAIVAADETRLHAAGARRIAHDEWAMPTATMGRPVRKHPALAAPYARPRGMPAATAFKVAGALAALGVRVKLHKPAGGSAWLVTPSR